MQKIVVISGINLCTGGPLSIYLDFLSSIVESNYDKSYKVIAFVHKKELFKDYFSSNIEFIELPKSRKSYLYRMFYEYVWFYWYSRKRNIYIWISLHDMTPNVIAQKRMVYCHSPLPFLSLTAKIIKKYPSTALMKYLYRYAYAINIKKNDLVIVQQNWMRKEFYKLFKLQKGSVAVAQPTMPIQKIENKKNNKFTFIYAAYPRFFKNYEVIAKAAKILQKRGKNFVVIFTIDGHENQYSHELYEAYNDVSSIKWKGLISREKVFELYSISDVLIFPSVLETWGLPISEFKTTEKPVILSDLPYAYEAIQPYDKVVFFDPNNENQLADIMEKAIEGTLNTVSVEEYKYEAPYYRNWNELLKTLLQ